MNLNINTFTHYNTHFEQVRDLINYDKKELEKIKAYKLRTKFLKNNNTKLGKGIYAFDLPAVISCPNHTECAKDCYADKGTFLWKDAKRSNTYNFIIALNDLQFLKDCLINELERRNINIIRIHSSGDFFSDDYFNMWVSIARKFPNLKIFTYTKTDKINVNELPSNFNIIDSFITYYDKDNNKIKILNFGSYDAIKPIAKKIRGLVCPITKGQATENERLKALTCSECKYCITKKKPLFVQH